SRTPRAIDEQRLRLLPRKHLAPLDDVVPEFGALVSPRIDELFVFGVRDFIAADEEVAKLESAPTRVERPTSASHFVRRQRRLAIKRERVVGTHEQLIEHEVPAAQLLPVEMAAADSAHEGPVTLELEAQP